MLPAILAKLRSWSLLVLPLMLDQALLAPVMYLRVSQDLLPPLSSHTWMNSLISLVALVWF